jgi:enamine deaminase RidA (YjgF/YER057c/UK114 family)
VTVFGDRGRHARAAVAVAGLPKNAAVEIQCVAELRE